MVRAIGPTGLRRIGWPWPSAPVTVATSVCPGAGRPETGAESAGDGGVALFGICRAVMRNGICRPCNRGGVGPNPAVGTVPLGAAAETGPADPIATADIWPDPAGPAAKGKAAAGGPAAGAPVRAAGDAKVGAGGLPGRRSTPVAAKPIRLCGDSTFVAGI